MRFGVTTRIGVEEETGVVVGDVREGTREVGSMGAAVDGVLVLGTAVDGASVTDVGDDGLTGVGDECRGTDTSR